MHYNCVWHTKPIRLSNFQVDTITNFEVIRQNVLSYARVMVIGVSSVFKSLLHQGVSEPECYGDLVYKLKKSVGTNNFSVQFIKIIFHYKKIGHNINVVQQTAFLVVNPITIGNFAFLYNCTLVGRSSDSMTVQTYLVMRWLRPGAVSVVVHPGLIVGFILLGYSVVCTVKPLLFYILIYMYKVIHGYVRDLSCKPNIYVS